MIRTLRPSALLLFAMTLLTGAIHPAVVTGLAQLVFPRSANGSFLERDGRTVASENVGQEFFGPGVFWSRPSAGGYGANPASGSNAGPLDRSMIERVEARVRALRESDPDNREPIPVDLVTASGSGLDPHISVAAARWQAPRVARERGLDPATVLSRIDEHVEGRQLGFLGEPRVNVVMLNLSFLNADH